MPFVIIVISLLGVSVMWLGFRSFMNRGYVKGKYRRVPKPDGHIAAEEAVFAEQMKIRMDYYQAVRANPPEIPRLNDTILASDDFDAARTVIDAYTELTREHPPESPLRALVVLRDFDYRSVWFLNGLSDIVKAAIYEEARGETAYLPTYGVLVVRAGDLEGMGRLFPVPPNS